jgi:large subunit ribosomal protein L16
MKFENPDLDRPKFRKRCTIPVKTEDKQRNRLLSGFRYGLVSVKSGIIFLDQIKTLFKTAMKFIKPKRKLSKRQKAEERLKIKTRKKKILKKEKASIFLSIFPRVSYTKKPVGVRMGKGKGGINTWGFPVRKGRIIIQIRKNISHNLAVKSLLQVKYRLPFLTKLIFK